MKKYFGMACYLLIVLSSCQKDDEAIILDPPKSGSTNFFNLKTGNTWVYKRFGYNMVSDEFIFDGKLDTMYIEKELMLNGEKYYKEVNKSYYNTQYESRVGEKSTYLLKVNKLGHLVRIGYPIFNSPKNEKTIHYGNDYNSADYIEDYDISSSKIGTVNYKLKPIQEIKIEGKAYKTYPFIGTFTPFENNAYKTITGFGNYYQENLGMIKATMYGLSSGKISHEIRLTNHFNQPVKIKNDIQSQLENLYDEILEMANPQSCSDPDKWKFTGIGYKACGGPTHYIAYYADIDLKLFMEKLNEYYLLDKKSKEGLFSDCSIALPPSRIECINNRPELIYEW